MHPGVAPLVLALAALFTADEPEAESFSVVVPGDGWSIDFKSSPLLRYAGNRKGKDFEFRAAGEQGFNLSIFIEEPKGAGDSHEACFEHYWPLAKRNPMIDQASVKVTKGDKYVRVAYEIRLGNKEDALRVRNVNYYFAHKGRWADVHASLFPPKETDEIRLEQFEKSLNYQPRDKESDADAGAPEKKNS